jgi:hypothetical protein
MTRSKPETQASDGVGFKIFGRKSSSHDKQAISSIASGFINLTVVIFEGVI